MAIFTNIKGKKTSSKNSAKILKNQEKYSKNNGENPSSNWWTVKVMAKKMPKNHFWSSGVIFGQFFGHNFLTIHRFELGFSPLFLEYFSAFLRIFSDFFDENKFLTFISKSALQNFAKRETSPPACLICILSKNTP